MGWIRAATVWVLMLGLAAGCSERHADACEQPRCPPDAVDGGPGGGSHARDGASAAGERASTSAGRGGASSGGRASSGDAAPEPETDAGVLRASFALVGPHRGSFTAVSATPTALLLATRTGIRRSRDAGETWSLLERPELRDVTAMAASGSELFIVADQRTYRSTDDGDSWQGIPLDLGQFATPHSYLSSRGSDVYLLARGEPYRLNAATASWDRLPNEGHGLSLDVLESDGSALYGNQASRGGVFRLDLGAPDAQWTAVEGLGEWGYSAFAFLDDDGFTANWMAMFQRSEATGWASLEAPFDRVSDLLALRGTIYAAAADGLHESVDRGVSWTTHAVGDAFSSRFALASDGTNVFAVSDALWRKRGPDDAWQRQALPADEVWRLASAGDSVLSISASGLLRSSDFAAGWDAATIAAQGKISSIAVRDGEVFVSASHSGVFASTDGGRSFVARSHPGNGSVDLIASIERGLLAGVSFTNGSILYLSTDGAQSWVKLPQVTGASYLGGLAESQGVLLMSGTYGGTYRSSDQGETWQRLALPPDIGNVREFATVQSVVFGVSSAGGVARSIDQGESWERAGLEALPVTSLAVFEGVVFAGVGSTQSFARGVYYSDDLGATWSRFDAGFDERVSALAIHEDRLLAGTLDHSTWAAPLASVRRER